MTCNMRKILSITAILAFATVIALMHSSCEKYILPEIKFSQDTVLFTAAGGTQTMQVLSTVKCTPNLSQEAEGWLTAGFVADGLDWDITLTAGANSGGERETDITCKSECITRSIIIIQAAAQE